MPIFGTSNWSWEKFSSSINCLPYFPAIDSSSHFFDQSWGKFFCSKFLVNTQKVDFGSFDFLSFDLEKLFNENIFTIKWTGIAEMNPHRDFLPEAVLTPTTQSSY